MPGSYLTPPPVLPLPDEGYGSRSYWKKELDAAVERLDQFRPDWDKNLASYKTKVHQTLPTTDSVVVPRDFPFVEQKISMLFFQVPEVHLKAKADRLADAVSIFQPVLNHYLSEDEVDALTVMNEVAFDALCPAGLLCSKIGYENFQGPPVDLGQPSPGPGVPLGAPPPPGMPPDVGHAAPGEEIPASPAPGPGAGPETLPGASGPVPGAVPNIPAAPGAAVPNIVHQRYFWERFSPAAARIPKEFSGSNYDKSPWLGIAGEDDWEVLKKRYGLPDDAQIPKSRDTNQDLKLKSEKNLTWRANVQKVKWTEIWYRTSVYDKVEVHPEKFRQLILVDGMDTPLVHRDSPYQSTNPSGELVGMLGNPIHIGALRYVSDSAFPPSEVTIARGTNEELNKSRTQMLLQRDRSIPMRFADLSRLGGEQGIEKIRKNIYQAIIPLATYDAGNPPLGAVSLSAFPRENFTFNDVLDHDLQQVWAMGANQRGMESQGKLTATEINKIDQWANSRLDKERRQMLRYFIKGVRKLGSLVQLFDSDEAIAEIVGQDELPRIQAWDRRNLPGKFSYSANPDSAIRIDQAQARTEILKLYELLAKDPNVSRTYLLTEIGRQWNMDPTKLVIEQLPPKGPDPANVSFRFNAEDLDVRNPNFPLYLAILKAAGYTTLDQPDPQTGLSPVQAAQGVAAHQAQIMGMAEGGPGPQGPPPPLGGSPPEPGPAPHPGTAPKADRLSKHRAEETGNLPGPKGLQ